MIERIGEGGGVGRQKGGSRRVFSLGPYYVEISPKFCFRVVNGESTQYPVYNVSVSVKCKKRKKLGEV